jgi:hypothetical protein
MSASPEPAALSTNPALPLGENPVAVLEAAVWAMAAIEPFLSETALRAALPRLVDALAPGAWLVAGTHPVADDELRRFVGRWTAVRGGGNSFDTARMNEELAALGLGERSTFPTVLGGPVLVAARRPEC